MKWLKANVRWASWPITAYDLPTRLPEDPEFEWDQEKAEINQRKHGVDFLEASSIFGDPLELTIPDLDHSAEEFRFISLGTSNAGRLILVSYTEREPRIRIITARLATPKERRQYESEQS